MTYVVKHGLHERDSDLGLLHEVVFCILNLKASMLLLGGSSVLKAVEKQMMSINVNNFIDG